MPVTIRNVGAINILKRVLSRLKIRFRLFPFVHFQQQILRIIVVGDVNGAGNVNYGENTDERRVHDRLSILCRDYNPSTHTYNKQLHKRLLRTKCAVHNSQFFITNDYIHMRLLLIFADTSVDQNWFSHQLTISNTFASFYFCRPRNWPLLIKLSTEHLGIFFCINMCITSSLRVLEKQKILLLMRKYGTIYTHLSPRTKKKKSYIHISIVLRNSNYLRHSSD